MDVQLELLLLMTAVNPATEARSVRLRNIRETRNMGYT